MPQYYVTDTVNPFVSGALAGFEMFDRAMDRRQQAKDRKRAMDLEDERMQMAREDQGMQRENFELGKKDRDRRIQIEDKDRAYAERLRGGKAIGDLAQIHGGLAKAPREEVIRLARTADPTKYASATDDEVYGDAYGLMVEGSDWAEEEAQRQRTRTEGRQDWLWQQNEASKIRRSEAEFQRQQLETGARGILSLLNTPEFATGAMPAIVKDKTPTPGGQRGGASDGAAGAMSTTPASVASAATESRGGITPLGAGHGAGYWTSEFRRAPEPSVSRWTAERARTDSLATRAALDIEAAKTIEQQANTVRAQIDEARTAGNTREVEALSRRALALQDNARTLSTGIAKDRVTATTNGRPVRPGEQAATAVREAATAQMGATPKAREAELRALYTQMGRLADNPPKRFTEDQLNRVSRAISLGVITMEQGVNLAQFGQMDKPAKPEVKVVGDMLALVSDAGIRFIDPADAAGGGKGGASLSSSEERLANKERAEFVAGQLKGMVESNEFDKFGPGNPNYTEVYGGFFEAITRFAPQIEQSTGVSLSAPGGGRTSLARVDEGTTNVLLQAYKDYRANELDAVSKDGKGFDYYVRQRLGVSEQAAQGATGEDWPVELLPD
jgi:hypothetical protein